LRARGLVALAAVLSPGGCDFIAPPDPLDLDPDFINIAILLVAGESRAHMLVGHPHRGASDSPPRVTADLAGADWRAEFATAPDQSACRGVPPDLPFPKICLRAVLPEPILAGATYNLDGEGPKGSFTGETEVPPAPRVLEPADTVWVPDSVHEIRIPIRYRASPEIGTLRPEVFVTLRDSAGAEESGRLRVSPRLLDVEGRAGTLSGDWNDEWKIRRGSLHLLGIGWHYTKFLRLDETRFPWPNFGVEGEGVYGYFDGSAKSRRVHIAVEEGS